MKIPQKLKEISELKTDKKYWNISTNLGEKLSNIVLEEKPSRILEFGTSNGYSALCMIKSLEELNLDYKIYTIEINEERLEEAKQNFKDCEVLDKVVTINSEIFDFLGFSSLEFEEICENKIDFVFLDAAQQFYQKIIENLLAKNVLDEGFTIVCDNILTHSTMEEFKEFMESKFDCFYINEDSGFLIAKKKK